MDQVAQTTDVIAQATKTINSVLTMSSSGAMIKIALLVATVAFTIWMSIIRKKDEVADARKEEGHEDNVNHDAAVAQNKTDNQQVKDDSKRIDDLLNGGKNG